MTFQCSPQGSCLALPRDLKNSKSLSEKNQIFTRSTYVVEGPFISRIKNSFKPHILRHFYYTTMQKLCEFEALYWPEIQCKCHKGNP